MILTITQNSKLEDIGIQFSKLFPGLKLDFFKNPEAGYEGPLKDLRCTKESTVKDFDSKIETDSFSFHENDSVSDFENRISSLLGINVQVFRRSKELWLQTVTTDEWSLANQNLKGMHSLLDHAQTD